MLRTEQVILHFSFSKTLLYNIYDGGQQGLQLKYNPKIQIQLDLESEMSSHKLQNLRLRSRLTLWSHQENVCFFYPQTLVLQESIQ